MPLCSRYSNSPNRATPAGISFRFHSKALPEELGPTEDKVAHEIGILATRTWILHNRTGMGAPATEGAAAEEGVAGPEKDNALKQRLKKLAQELDSSRRRTPLYLSW